MGYRHTKGIYTNESQSQIEAPAPTPEPEVVVEPVVVKDVTEDKPAESSDVQNALKIIEETKQEPKVDEKKEKKEVVVASAGKKKVTKKTKAS